MSDKGLRLKKYDLAASWREKYLGGGGVLDFKIAQGLFLRELRRRNYQASSLENYEMSLKPFGIYLAKKNKTDLCCVNSTDLTDYVLEVLQRPWVLSTKKLFVERVKLFFAFLTKENLLLLNPADTLAGAFKNTVSKVIPQVLTPDEARRLLDVTCAGWYMHLRDKAILELLYSSGLRLSEVIRLKVEDVDLENGLVMICEGKGIKDRMVPLGKRAREAIKIYTGGLRPLLLVNACLQSGRASAAGPLTVGPPAASLFLSLQGGELNEKSVRYALVRRARAAGITKRLYPHLLRHTMATHLLTAGAPIRVVQEILGHELLSTTQIYTHVDKNSLRKIWKKYHPRGRWLWKSGH